MQQRGQAQLVANALNSKLLERLKANEQAAEAAAAAAGEKVAIGLAALAATSAARHAQDAALNCMSMAPTAATGGGGMGDAGMAAAAGAGAATAAAAAAAETATTAPATTAGTAAVVTAAAAGAAQQGADARGLVAAGGAGAAAGAAAGDASAATACAQGSTIEAMREAAWRMQGATGPRLRGPACNSQRRGRRKDPQDRVRMTSQRVAALCLDMATTSPAPVYPRPHCESHAVARKSHVRPGFHNVCVGVQMACGRFARVYAALTRRAERALLAHPGPDAARARERAIYSCTRCFVVPSRICVC